MREPLRQASEGLRVALVGGAVRDLMLHHLHRDPLTGMPDLDLLVEPPGALVLAERLRQRMEAVGRPLVLFRPHPAYGTVEIGCDALLLDLATARAETYPRPAENPVVQPGRLEDDLARRDFSINAMALVLQPGDGATLLDPHGGQHDLAARQLRLLHGRSLTDDPTRLVRAARYGARQGLSLEPASLEQARRTLAAWPWPWRPGDPPQQAPPALGTRLRMEFDLLLEREPWPRALALLQAWGGLALLDAGLQADQHWRPRLRRAQRLGVPLLPALLTAATNPVALAARLQLPHGQQRWLALWLALRAGLPAPAVAAAWPPSRWCALLEAPGCSAEAVALAIAAGDGPRRPLLRWWLHWRRVQPPLSAAELMAREGLSPGPALGERLRQLRAEQLDRLP
ncbi:MAG: CCA tRNA nucleotidyltransferase [Synechococcus sp.]